MKALNDFIYAFMTSIHWYNKHEASMLCLNEPYLLLNCMFLIKKTSYQIVTNWKYSLFWNNPFFDILASSDITYIKGQ